MSYLIMYTEKAAKQLDGLPPEFVDIVESNLLRLAATPASLSVRIASPPFPPRGQLFHFETTGSIRRQ